MRLGTLYHTIIPLTIFNKHPKSLVSKLDYLKKKTMKLFSAASWRIISITLKSSVFGKFE